MRLVSVPVPSIFQNASMFLSFFSTIVPLSIDNCASLSNKTQDGAIFGLHKVQLCACADHHLVTRLSAGRRDRKFQKNLPLLFPGCTKSWRVRLMLRFSNNDSSPCRTTMIRWTVGWNIDVRTTVSRNRSSYVANRHFRCSNTIVPTTSLMAQCSTVTCGGKMSNQKKISSYWIYSETAFITFLI